MDQIPGEIRLDIIEYTPPSCDTDRRNSMDVSDVDLVQRIRVYDPSFNYNEWRSLLTTKRQLYAIYDNTSTYTLYQMIDSYSDRYNISLNLSIHRERISHTQGSNHVSDLVQEIVDMFHMDENDVYNYIWR